MLPIPDPMQLLDWAKSAPWDRLSRFVKNYGARGHDQTTIEKLVQIVERRRWAEEERVRGELAAERNHPVLSNREKIWEASERRYQSLQTLEELRRLDPYDFERFIADLFNSAGYTAATVGGPFDMGIDVTIHKNGSLWGVVQCKRYATQNRVSGREVMAFAGAFALTGAEVGFFFTTGILTRHARKTARGYPWLTVYSGSDLVTYINSFAGRGQQGN